MWKWEEHSILNVAHAKLQASAIFQAVCSEIARYYQDQMKYTKSNRLLKWQGNHLRCQFGFFSSHSNRSGEWVNFEIVTSVFALDFTGMERKGILCFNMRPKNFDIHNIDETLFEEIITYINRTLQFVKECDSKEGMETFISNNKDLKRIATDSNYMQYLKSLG